MDESAEVNFFISYYGLIFSDNFRYFPDILISFVTRPTYRSIGRSTTHSEKIWEGIDMINFETLKLKTTERLLRR